MFFNVYFSRTSHDNVVFTEDLKRTSTQKWLIRKEVHMVKTFYFSWERSMIN